MMFSDDETRIEVYTKAAVLDYHIDSIPYIWTELNKIQSHRSAIKELDADVFLFNETKTNAHIPEEVRKN